MSNNETINKLESEGTDSDVTSAEFRKKFNLKNTLAVLILLAICTQNVSANQLHLFSDHSGSVVGTITSNTDSPILLEGFIENNILEAIEVTTTKPSVMNTEANSDGTGGSNTEANSDGTGGTQTEANSDGTGKNLISIVLSCGTDSRSSSMALIESEQDSEVLHIDTVYLDNQIYICN